MEKIICAAIQLDNGKVYYGHRHNHCIEACNAALSWNLNRQEMSKIERVQGFVTSTGRFVDRKEAMIIARLAKQISLDNTNEELYSEDLY